VCKYNPTLLTNFGHDVITTLFRKLINQVMQTHVAGLPTASLVTCVDCIDGYFIGYESRPTDRLMQLKSS
jgi:hypothetical protein